MAIKSRIQVDITTKLSGAEEVREFVALLKSLQTLGKDSGLARLATALVGELKKAKSEAAGLSNELNKGAAASNSMVVGVSAIRSFIASARQGWLPILQGNQQFFETYQKIKGASKNLRDDLTGLRSVMDQLNARLKAAAENANRFRKEFTGAITDARRLLNAAPGGALVRTGGAGITPPVGGVGGLNTRPAPLVPYDYSQQRRIFETPPTGAWAKFMTGLQTGARFIGANWDKVREKIDTARNKLGLYNANFTKTVNGAYAAWRMVDNTLGMILRRLVAIAAIIGGTLAAGVALFVREGLEFNTTMEETKLGLAALISTFYEIRNAQGQTLDGAEKFNAAVELAAAQQRQLLFAALQTNATPAQLVRGYQEAIAATANVGLNLKQAGTLTVLLTQAAQAFHIQMDQINEEIRNLLSGTATRNTRLAIGLFGSPAKANEEIKKLRAQGHDKFFEGLVQKLRFFELAAPRLSETLSAAASNVYQSLQMIAGATTEDLYNRTRKFLDGLKDEFTNIAELRKKAQESGRPVADFADEFGISEKYRALVDYISGILTVIFTKLEGGFNFLLSQVQEVSKWIANNRDEAAQVLSVIDGIWALLVYIVQEVVGLPKQIGAVTGESENWLTTSKAILRIVAFIIDAFDVIFSSAVAIGAAIVRGFLLPISVFLSILGLAGAIMEKMGLMSAETSASIFGMAKGAAALVNALSTIQSVAGRRVGKVLTGGGASGAVNEALNAPVDPRRLNVTRSPLGVGGFSSSPRKQGGDDDGDKNKSKRDWVNAETSAWKRLAEEIKKAQEARAEYNALVEQRGNTELSAQLEATPDHLRNMLEQNRISYEEYYDRLRAKTTAFYELERGEQERSIETEKETQRAILAAREEAIAAVEKRRDALRAKQKGKLTPQQTDAFEAELAAARAQDGDKFIQTLTKIEQAKQNIAKLNVKEKQDQENLTYEELKALDDLRQKFRDVQATIEELAGTEQETAQASINKKYEELRTIQLKNKELLRAVDLTRAEQLELAKLRIDRLQTQIGITDSNAEADKLDIQRQYVQHLITESELNDQIAAVEKERLRVDIQRKQLQLNEAISKGLDPATIAKLRVELAGLNLELAQVRTTSQQFFEGLRETLEGGLVDAFTSIITGTKGIRQAFADLARSVVQYITQMIMKMLVAKLIMMAFNAFGGAGTSFGNAPTTVLSGTTPAPAGFAKGGYLKGPGTGSSDSILARLSNGEFVMPADAVRKYGVGFMEMIRRARLPRFATGGLAGTASSLTPLTTGMQGMRVNIANVLDPDLFHDYLDKFADRVLVNRISRNQAQYRSAMGL